MSAVPFITIAAGVMVTPRHVVYCSACAVVVGEARPFDILTETITMIILAFFATLAGIAALCWLLFSLAVFALPFFAGLSIGLWAHDTGTGIPGGVIIGLVAAVATFSLFQLLLAVARPTWVKLAVIAAFVTPATIAGYHATLGITRLTMPSDIWQVSFAVVGAIAVGITAFTRLTMMTPPGGPRTAGAT